MNIDGTLSFTEAFWDSADCPMLVDMRHTGPVVRIPHVSNLVHAWAEAVLDTPVDVIDEVVTMRTQRFHWPEIGIDTTVVHGYAPMARQLVIWDLG